MDKNKDCFFCDIVDGGKDARGIVPELLLETKNYIVIPEAHSMLSNTAYTLTISKEHKKSLLDFSQDLIEEERNIENLLREKIYDQTGKKAITFEHGADGAKSVDHAHIHNVGNDGLNAKTLKGIFDENIIKTNSGIYLYYRGTDGKETILPLEHDLISQYMRIKLWEDAGNKTDFYTHCNWKKPTPEIAKRFLENERFTIDVLKGSFTDRDKGKHGL
jgi:diadenosine tetraphosphate (Ap4A) HIT family hydrolase